MMLRNNYLKFRVRFIFATVLFFVASGISTVLAQTVNFSGKVQTVTGTGIANALVKLNNTTLSARTGTDGSFSLVGQGSTIQGDKGGLVINDHGNSTVRASLFSLQGKRLCSFESRGPGASRELNAMFQRQAAGLYLVEVSANNITSAKVLYSPGIGAMCPIRILEDNTRIKALARQTAAGQYVLSASATGYLDRAVLQSQPVASGIIIVLPSQTGDSSSAKLGNASAFLMNDTLTVSTGKVMRSWKWTGYGFATISFVNLVTGKQWVQKAPSAMADWSFYSLINNTSTAQLMGLSSKAVTNYPLRSDHVEVVAEINYPNSHLNVKYMIWAYPDAPGLRTQLFVKSTAALPAVNETDTLADRIDMLPISFGSSRVHAAGHSYTSPTENSLSIDVIKEDTASNVTLPKIYNWSNMVLVEESAEGMGMVKEGNKTLKQKGLIAGVFTLDANGLSSNGWSLKTSEILSTRYRQCWASWCIAYSGGQDEQQLAIKTFDRLRFPVDTARDIVTLSNNWGGPAQLWHKDSLTEANILLDIPVCKNLGIDVMQVDALPDISAPIQASAKANGVILGSWNWWNANLTTLMANYNKDSRHLKLDLMSLAGYDNFEQTLSTADSLQTATNYSARINWDITEQQCRFGFFFAREYGSMWFINRYVNRTNMKYYFPAVILRYAWQFSKYINLNKFQIPIDDVDKYDSAHMDPNQYGHTYCMAIALMGTPMFFQQVHNLSDSAKNQIRPLLAIYKQQRKAMFKAHVFPVGKTPNDSSWTGFQSYDPSTGSGHLIIFRERYNLSSTSAIPLRFVSGKSIFVENLIDNTSRTVPVPADGSVGFSLNSPKSFLFCKYTIKP